ncbi:13427_t:CDS:2, partial [Dentiscutata erythropus]
MSLGSLIKLLQHSISLNSLTQLPMIDDTINGTINVNASPTNLKNRRNLEKRRFGQEHTPQADATFQEVKDIAQGTDKEEQAGNLSGAMVRALLAKAPACDQQDRADEVIDLGKELGGDKLNQMVKVAQAYRQLERNTPKDGQPSALCNKAPRNKELDGLTQAQDPTGGASNTQDPNAQNPANTQTPTTQDPTGGASNTQDPNAQNPANTQTPTTQDPNSKGNICTSPADPNTTGMPKGKKAKKDKKKKKKNNGKKNNGKKNNGKKNNGKKNLLITTNNVTSSVNPTSTNGAVNADAVPSSTPTCTPTSTPTSDSSQNNQNPAFANPVGGVQMPLITKNSDGTFDVNGNNFKNIGAAQNRQCDIQHNACFNKLNGGDKSITNTDCDNQDNVCKSGPP